MWQNVITQKCLPELSMNQHGFLPGRGVITAWRDIFTNVVDKDNIYEYDLKGFFDNVSLKAIEQWLLDIGCPYPIVE
jgi:retron-type reverse transcriptase